MSRRNRWEIEDYPSPDELDGMVLVDAYYIPKEDAGAYIADREKYAEKAAAIFREHCPLVYRDWAGSEDGEAVLGCDAAGKLRMLIHLDPEGIEQMKKADGVGRLRRWLLDYNEFQEDEDMGAEYQVSPRARQAMTALTGLDEVQRALRFLKEDHENSIAEQLELVRIPAPTFHEQERAAYMAEHFRALGLADVRIDQTGNAVGVRRGSGGGPAVVIDGHMDTVYPLETALEPRRDEDFIYCPGIVDDTRACAAMLSLIRALDAVGIRTERDLVFLATVQEEGRGAFGGMRGFCSSHPEIGASVCLDGYGAQGIVYQSTGFKTIEVTFQGIGGHAYSAFGEVANPLHAAARAVAKIADLPVPDEPKTTYCVSNFHAGNEAGIHAIVPFAAIKINYRSNGQSELEALDREIFRCIDEACAEETARWGKDTITYSVKTYCEIPAGSLGEHDPIVEAAWTAIQYLGKEPRLLKGGPTNASIPIGRGIPAVCLGDGDIDTFCHNAALERFPVKDTWEMPQLALLVALSAAGVQGKSGTILE